MTALRKPVPVTRDSTGGEREGATLHTLQGWEPFASLRRDIDRLFDDMMSAWRPGRLFEASPWQRLATSLPTADIVEKDDQFVMRLDVPGMDEKDIEVKLSDGAITIRGEKRQEKAEEKESYRLSERRHGSFARSFSLPASVDRDKVSATYDKGVLKLIMPKTGEARQKQRKIEVKAA